MNRDDMPIKKDRFTMVAPIAVPAEVEEIEQDAARNFEMAYHELIYAVSEKYPGETRHETALRYIREAEKSAGPEKEDRDKTPA